jgi:SPP1 family predicted phage head-tail adaptor
VDVKIDILQKREEIEDGREHKEYADYYNNVWATPVDLYGNEIYDALNAKLENTIIFEVKYCKKIKSLQAHCKKYVIRYEGEIYDLYHASFKKNEKTTVLLKANRQS